MFGTEHLAQSVDFPGLAGNSGFQPKAVAQTRVIGYLMAFKPIGLGIPVPGNALCGGERVLHDLWTPANFCDQVGAVAQILRC